jgi:hypothetical protein
MDEVLTKHSFDEALKSVGLGRIINPQEQEFKHYEAELPEFDVDAEELQTLLTVCGWAVRMDPQDALIFLAQNGFGFGDQCESKGSSSIEVIQQVFVNCKKLAFEYHKSSMRKVRAYAMLHRNAKYDQLQELFDREKQFSPILFNERRRDHYYELAEAFNSASDEDLGEAIKDFSIDYPGRAISVVFQTQHPSYVGPYVEEEFEDVEGELSEQEEDEREEPYGGDVGEGDEQDEQDSEDSENSEE